MRGESAKNGKAGAAACTRMAWLVRARFGPTHHRRPVYMLAGLPVELLGAMPDHVLAAFAGLTIGMVIAARDRLGIELDFAPLPIVRRARRCACGRMFRGLPRSKYCSRKCIQNAGNARRRGGDVDLHVALGALRGKVEAANG